MSKHSYIIDTTSNRLLESFTSTRAAKPDSLVFGDAAQVSVQLVEPNSNNAEWPWQYVDLTGQTIRVGVGSLSDATPSAYIELTDDIATPSATVTVIREGVLNTTNELVRVQINDAYAGNYTLTVAGETTNPICLSGPLDTLAEEIEGLTSITADSVWITGTATDYNIEFNSSLDDIGAITVAVDALLGYKGKTGTLDLHVEEILTLLDGGTEIAATLEVVRWTTADVAGETVLQAPVMVRQDVIPDTVPGTTPIPGYPVDLDQITQSGAVTGQVPSWNGSEWVPITASGTGDMLASVYDPAPSVNGSAFDMDNMVEGATNKILTAAERTKLGSPVLTDVIDKMAFNVDDLTFDVDTGTGVVVQIGQELLVKARNVTGSTITNGSVVRINGASGDRPTITPAQADSLANISGIIGIVTADILNNAVGFVTVHGLVRGLDTSTYTEGDELFLSSSVAGGFTSTEPTLSIPIGTVTFANPASGEVFANVDNQKHLLEFASDPTLLGNFSAASWKTALAIAAADVDFGTGTDSYVWTSDGAGGAAWEALAGGGGGGSSEFLDSAFRIQDDGDITKEAAFELSGLTTATTRTITLPDKDGTMAMTSDISGGGLTQVAGTDADTTMGVGNMYVVDMTSWGTSSRTYRLPATAAVGEQIGITIKVGNANHELSIRSTIGSGDTINGVDHDADDWSRLFQAGETVIMECVTANSDWIVINDGRKPCAARIEKTDAQALINNSYDQVELNTETYNRGLTTDVVTNYRITVRRDGLYNVSSLVRLDDTELTFNNADWCLISVYLDGVINEVQHGNTGADSSNRIDARYNTTYELTAGQYLETFVFTTGTTGSDLVAASSAPNWLAVKEIL